MSGEHSFDVFFARKLDGIRILGDVEAIEVFKQTKALEWGLCLRWQLETFADLIV